MNILNWRIRHKLLLVVGLIILLVPFIWVGVAQALGSGKIKQTTSFAPTADKPLNWGFSVSRFNDYYFNQAREAASNKLARDKEIASQKRVRAHLKWLEALEKQRAAVKTAQALAEPSNKGQATLPTVYQPPKAVSSNCGSDPYMAYIYQHESGCRTNAIGPNGPCGLGQALPCSKMGCSLYDWACQNRFFVGYAIARYGSTRAAYSYWIGHSNW